MKVEPCKKDVPQFPLKWHEAIEREGIYEAYGCSGYWVVVIGPPHSAAKFWTNGRDIENVPNSSEGNMYRRVNATLCLEVRVHK